MAMSIIVVSTRFGILLSLGQRPSGLDWLCLLLLTFFCGFRIVAINCTFLSRLARFFHMIPDADGRRIYTTRQTSILLNPIRR
ncbi:hypothetical protein F5X99DRAFT_381552 [Biscogniauxia marginata]|nr:hypothetical protein F5X99DRAFT_381552 [Biscogniauxia marginata]